MNSITVLLACVAAVYCNDLQEGANHGRVIFNQEIQASPAIWRQSQKVTINATNTEVISGVVVTDQRPDKDGDAKIIEGGEGQKNVTIELKSPTVFRGFDFKVVVYAMEEDVKAPLPVLITKDTDVNVSGKPEDKDSVTITTENISTTTLPSNGKPVNDKTDKPSIPVIAGDQTRNYRNTHHVIDPIVSYINDEMTTEVTDLSTSTLINSPETTTFNSKTGATDRPLKVDGPITHPVLFNTDKVMDENKTSHSDVNKQLHVPKVSSTEIPQSVDRVKIENLSTSSTTPRADFTTEGDVSTSTATERIRAPITHQNFENISKELGQKVVFGIKKH